MSQSYHLHRYFYLLGDSFYSRQKLSQKPRGGDIFTLRLNSDIITLQLHKFYFLLTYLLICDKNKTMFFKYLPIIVLATVLLYGCAGNHVYKSQSTYLTGFSFYDPQKTKELEGVTEGDIIHVEPSPSFSKQKVS